MPGLVEKTRSILIPKYITLYTNVPQINWDLKQNAFCMEVQGRKSPKTRKRCDSGAEKSKKLKFSVLKPISWKIKISTPTLQQNKSK